MLYLVITPTASQDCLSEFCQMTLGTSPTCHICRAVTLQYSIAILRVRSGFCGVVQVYGLPSPGLSWRVSLLSMDFMTQNLSVACLEKPSHSVFIVSSSISGKSHAFHVMKKKLSGIKNLVRKIRLFGRLCW